MSDQFSANLLVMAKQMRDLTDAIMRASVAMRELEHSRTSDDIERVRHGVQHELETARGILGVRMPERMTPECRAERKAAIEQLTIEASE